MALIFFDLDGTTLFHGKPANGVVESIEMLKNNGHIVAIATGRGKNLLYDINKQLGIENLVLSNGFYVVHKNEVIYEKSFSNETIQKLMKYVDDNKVDLIFEYENEFVAYRKENKELIHKFSDTLNIDYPREDHNFYPNKSIFGMVVFTDEETISNLRIAFPDLAFNMTSFFGYDISINHEMKAEGVKELIKYLNIPFENTYAFGDGHNDITMIKAVNHGIAMGNADDEVKTFANYVTTNVDDYGVLNALKHFKLI